MRARRVGALRADLQAAPRPAIREAPAQISQIKAATELLGRCLEELQ
jgi:hypothetical protein